MIQQCCTPGQKSLGHIKEQPLNAFLVQIHGEYFLLSAFMSSIRLVLVLISSWNQKHEVIGAFLFLFNGTLVHCEVIPLPSPSIWFLVSIYLHGWRKALWEWCVTQEQNKILFLHQQGLQKWVILNPTHCVHCTNVCQILLTVLLFSWSSYSLC